MKVPEGLEQWLVTLSLKDADSYLGLPLTVRKPTKAEYSPSWQDCWYPPWVESFPHESCWSAHYSTCDLHCFSCLPCDCNGLAPVDKRCRGFLWKVQVKANGGNCLVSWERVQHSIQYGGLSILNLESLGWALHLRWLWLQKTDADRLWAGLPIQVPQNTQALFNVAAESIVGNEKSTMFWSLDRLLIMGQNYLIFGYKS